MFNTKNETVSLGRVFVTVKLDTKVNARTGDVDVKMACCFYGRSCVEAGTYTVIVRGDHVYPVNYQNSGNGEELWAKYGNDLLEQFQLI